jgi:probable HAF family extracellular repeat protein
MVSHSTRVLLWLAVAAGYPAAASAQGNQLIDLGAGYGMGLNDSGQAVIATSNGVVQSAELYSNGTITPLPLTESLAINASGEVAGTDSAGHAAVYSNGTLTDLGLLPGSSMGSPGVYTNATAINTNGQVVGVASLGPYIDAFSYNNGTMTDIGYLPGAAPPDVPAIFSEAYGVNDSGEITGFSAGPDGYCHVFLYQNGTMTDLGLGGGNAINASGQVTGVLATPQSAAAGCPPSGHAFLYANGTMTDIGALPGGSYSAGYAINASGQIVGFSDVGAGTDHAFFYNGALTDLNALIDPADPLRPYVTLSDARGINVNRLILANGVDSRSPHVQRAYLLQGPWIDITPGTLSFASQPVGTISPAQSVRLANSGAAPLTLGNASVTGDFAQSSNCGATLTAGNSCTVSVTFTPTAAGNPTGTLTVVSDGAPSTIALTGIAPISLSLSSSASSVTMGMPVTLSWSVSAGASCTATGGTAADGWTGSLSGNGSQSVREVAAGDYLYGLSCTADKQTAQAQAPVLVNNPPAMAPIASSGGGALDLQTLIALFGLGTLRVLRHAAAGHRIRF